MVSESLQQQSPWFLSAACNSSYQPENEIVTKAAACNSRQQVDARIVSTHQQATAISQGQHQQLETNNQQLEVKLLNAALQLESSQLEATISSLTSSFWTQRCSLIHRSWKQRSQAFELSVAARLIAAGSNNQQLEVKYLNAALQLDSSQVEATISSLKSSIGAQRCSLNHQQL
jgi:hypothetical protein